MGEGTTAADAIGGADSAGDPGILGGVLDSLTGAALRAASRYDAGQGAAAEDSSLDMIKSRSAGALSSSALDLDALIDLALLASFCWPFCCFILGIRTD
jgi:hypothetical protein